MSGETRRVEREPTATDVREVLERARARITAPEHWTTAAPARMGLIPIANPNNVNARAWSADGAVRAESGGHWTRLGNEAFRLLAEAAGVPPLEMPAWNDQAGHKVVLAAFDRAIAQLKTSG